MKKIFKSRLFIFILGVISAIGITSVLAYSLFAPDVGFNPIDNLWKKQDGTTIENVDEALNDLHSKINSIAFKKICKYIDNTYSKDPNDRFSIGTKYECDPGDNVKRNFYILKVSSEKIDLIMEQNIIDSTMTWYVAMEYFRSGDGKTTKDSWTDVQDLDLPKIQDIIDAVGRTSWNAAENNSYWCMESQRQDSSSNPYCYNNDGNLETLWLWDYFADCGGWNCEHNLGSGHANGYWARDAVANTSWAWGVSYFSLIDRDVATYSTKYGIRPTITVFKTNLYG